MKKTIFFFLLFLFLFNAEKAFAIRDFSASISPTSVSVGQTTTYTYILTNSTSSTASIGSFKISIPSGFSTPSIGIVSAPGGKIWNATFNSTTTKIELAAQGAANKLAISENIQIQISDAAPNISNIYEWTVEAFSNLDFTGSLPFTIISFQPVVTVNKLHQTISLAPIPDKTIGDPDFDIEATTTSGLILDMSATGDCSVSGITVHLMATGSCAILASQPGNQMYEAASSSVSFLIADAAVSTSTISTSSSLQSTSTASTTQSTPKKHRRQRIFFSTTTEIVVPEAEKEIATTSPIVAEIIPMPLPIILPIHGEVLGAEKYFFSDNLVIGMKSNAVFELQERLKAEKFFTGTSTEYFDKETRSALKLYQKAHSIFPSGILGVATRLELNK